MKKISQNLLLDLFWHRRVCTHWRLYPILETLEKMNLVSSTLIAQLSHIGGGIWETVRSTNRY